MVKKYVLSKLSIKYLIHVCHVEYEKSNSFQGHKLAKIRQSFSPVLANL